MGRSARRAAPQSAPVGVSNRILVDVGELTSGQDDGFDGGLHLAAVESLSGDVQHLKAVLAVVNGCLRHDPESLGYAE